MRLEFIVDIEGNSNPDPTTRVLAMEHIAEELSKKMKFDRADAVMMLLAAAVRIHRTAAKDINQTPEVLGAALACAIRSVLTIDGLRKMDDAE